MGFVLVVSAGAKNVVRAFLVLGNCTMRRVVAPGADKPRLQGRWSRKEEPDAWSAAWRQSLRAYSQAFLGADSVKSAGHC